MAFLDRTTPPAFVSLTGKGRTFQPEDSDVVYSSVRPERLNEVDADTRDAWVVDAAEATLRRIAVAAAAREMDARGDTLHDRLVDAGVDESLATGVTLALDHYRTTASYLESLRTVATEALAVVADERDEVSATTSAPDADEGATVGPLPEHVELGVVDDEPVADNTVRGSGVVGHLRDSVSVVDDVESGDDGEPATATTGVTADAGGDGTESGGDGLDEPDSVAASTDETTVDSGTTETTVDAVTGGAADPTDDTGTESTTDTDDLGGFDDTAGTDDTASSDTTAGDTVSSGTAVDETETDDLGGFDDAGSTESDGTLGDTRTDETLDETETNELGGFDEPDTSGVGGDESSAVGDEPGGFGGSDTGDASNAGETGGPGDVSPDEDDLDDALTDEERAEVRSEHGVGFSSGTEVPEPEESELDAPDPEEITPTKTEPDTASTGESPPAETEPTGGVASSTGTSETAGSAGEDDTTAADSGADATADTGNDGADGAVDVDLEAAAVEIMGELDDGDGADREAVMAVAVDRHGADPAAVEEAIQEALMSGQCYEAGGGLKPI